VVAYDFAADVRRIVGPSLLPRRFALECGNRINRVLLRTEADACFYLLGRLAYTQLERE
jgi:hypothetical protein